jgi:anaerobic glycerol-3-phosphate dehydrogenase
MNYDLAIIGGGPAGVAAGVYAARKELKTIFITKDWESQSTVSEGIENWIGTIKIKGSDFAKSLENHLKAYAKDIVDIHEKEPCSNVEKVEGGFYGIIGFLFRRPYKVPDDLKNIRENLFIEAKTLQKELDKQSEKENNNKNRLSARAIKALKSTYLSKIEKYTPN